MLRMAISALAAITSIFVLAGFVKGVVGLGLPTVAMGLLAVVMTPAQAAALLVVPSFLTNAWQAMGPELWPLTRRLWSMLLGICAGTWAGAGLITAADGAQASAALGAVLALYGVLGLTAVEFPVPGRFEPAIGVATGIVTAATGVYMIPSAPYLQAIGLEKDRLVQALGCRSRSRPWRWRLPWRGTARSASRSPALRSPCSRRRCSAWRWVSGCAPGCANGPSASFSSRPRCCSARTWSCVA